MNFDIRILHISKYFSFFCVFWWRPSSRLIGSAVTWPGCVASGVQQVVSRSWARRGERKLPGCRTDWSCWRWCLQRRAGRSDGGWAAAPTGGATRWERDDRKEVKLQKHSEHPVCFKLPHLLITVDTVNLNTLNIRSCFIILWTVSSKNTLPSKRSTQTK